MAVVAKGVSPPDLGLWLVSFFASSETESAAQPGRALGFSGWSRIQLEKYPLLLLSLLCRPEALQ